MTREIASVPRPRIRILLVEDSATALYALQGLIASAPDMEVVGTARDGREALGLLTQLRPDVVCTDYHMPVMDGLELILNAMRIYPCAILVLSVAVQSFQQDNIFKLLAAGAVDVIAKPIGDGHGIGAEQASELLDKIRAIARAPAMRQRLLSRAGPVEAATALIEPAQRVAPAREVGLVVIGASTGGPQVLHQILGHLPKTFPAPVVCVQHISQGFLDGMLSWLRTDCALPIRLARAGDPADAGQVYFAPDGHHLTLDGTSHFRLGSCAGHDLHCPSVDRLMESVAQSHGAAAIGVLLSGMGRDGAAGLKKMRDAGAHTIVQDAATSVIFGMPAAAIALGAAESVLPSGAIAERLIRLTGAMTS